MRPVSAVGLAMLLGGCINLQEMPPDLPCREAAFAIAARTEACAGDAALANARVAAFEEEYVCIAIDVTDPDFSSPAVDPVDLFDCAFTIRELPCELIAAYGDDLDAYQSTSYACTWSIARRDGQPIGGGR